MNIILRQALGACGLAFATCASAQISFYENEGFSGRSFTTQKQVQDFTRFGFNDRASSVIVTHERWEVCDDARFGGRCMILRPGRYPSLQAMGLNDRISSVRVVDPQANMHDSRYAPAPVASYDYHRRSDERLYDANVTSVRAVVGQAEQRCWVEREQVQQHGDANVPGAVVGAVLGGILGQAGKKKCCNVNVLFCLGIHSHSHEKSPGGTTRRACKLAEHVTPVGTGSGGTFQRSQEQLGAGIGKSILRPGGNFFPATCFLF